MNIFELRHDYKVNCEFIGDNETDEYQIVFKWLARNNKTWVECPMILSFSEITEMLSGLDQLKKTLTDAVESHY